MSTDGGARLDLRSLQQSASTAETAERGQGDILVVEDDDMTAALVAHLIGRGGFRVVRARDGREAIDRLATLAPPSLVLLDLMLPYADGFTVLREIRSRAGWTDVPVVLLSAQSEEAAVIRALDAGADDYVVKPFRPEEFMARLRRVLK